MHHSGSPAGAAPTGIARGRRRAHPSPWRPARRPGPLRPGAGQNGATGPTDTADNDLKLHQDPSEALNTVTGYGPDYVDINLARHEHSVIVLPAAPVMAWPVDAFEALEARHFELLLDPSPEVVIFGSGARLRFPHPRLTAALAARRIGVETMDFQAACRTYNILMGEGRKVAASLLIERPAA